MVYSEGETPLEVGEDGRILIEREAEEVFRPETMASFEGKPVTIGHPTEFVTPDNWSRLAMGALQNVRRGDGGNESDLIADLLITNSVAINLVKAGLREVSCGYEASYTQTGPGRGIQTKLVGNHLALVDEGRAGSSYAINDHKGKGRSMKLSDKIKAIFAKAQDEALKVADAEEKEPPKKDDKKDDSKDAMGAYDELVNMVKDLGSKIEGMMKPKDETSNANPDVPAIPVVKDDETAPAMEDRLKALETSVSKILESMAAKGNAGDEEGAEADESEEAEDDDFEESTLTGDTASRIEILAPGFKSAAKDEKAAKSAAIKAAYATTDGKKVIDQLTGGKAPLLDTPEKVNTIFIAASELLKISRTSELARTKDASAGDSAPDKASAMTAEKMNELNAKHYGKK